MKKIGTLTFVNTVNYGAVLQATALQYFLSKKDFEVHNFNYCLEHEGLNNRPIYKIILTKIWSIFKLFLGYRLRVKNTNNFIAQHLKLTKKITTPSEIKKYSSFYDYFIVGSDQVWNPNIIGKDMNYFLDFVPNDKVKISYAASFGLNNLPLEYSKYVNDKLKSFNAISVREVKGQDILNNLGFESEVVLDPTLLLTREDWKNFYSKERLVKEKYILCYFMPGNKILEKKITEISDFLSRETGFKIVNIGKKEYTKLNFKRNNRVTDGPGEFLNLIANSEYILTNSFHGLVFGLNFNKNVYPFIEKTFSDDLSLSSRLLSILDLTNCDYRIVYSDTTCEEFLKIKNIDFLSLNNFLEINRLKSIDFLDKSLKSV